MGPPLAECSFPPGRIFSPACTAVRTETLASVNSADPAPASFGRCSPPPADGCPVFIPVCLASAPMLLIFIFLLMAAYAVPPLLLANSGLGDRLAILFGGFVLALAFLLQTGEVHVCWLLSPSADLLALAHCSSGIFPPSPPTKVSTPYAAHPVDLAAGHPLHHLLLILAYLLFSSAFFGFPGRSFPGFPDPAAGNLHRLCNGSQTADARSGNS